MHRGLHSHHPNDIKVERIAFIWSTQLDNHSSSNKSPTQLHLQPQSVLNHPNANMYFTTIVASVAALAMGASAAPASGPYDPFAQVRLYPQSDCEQPNVGYLSVRRSGINKCGQLDGTYTI